DGSGAGAEHAVRGGAPAHQRHVPRLEVRGRRRRVMSRFVCCGLAIVAGAGLMLAAAGVKGWLADRGDRQVVPELGEPVATYSILGYDPETGEIGGAVQSRVFSVGNGVLWGE